MPTEGLRERGKARRRAAITRAAFELFAERGYDSTTVAEVAAAAEVSPRTVTLYFRSKQDIALSRFTESADRLTEALRLRGPGESALDVMGGWLRAEFARHDEIDLLSKRMLETNPELRALQTARMEAAVQEGVKAIALDTGRAVDDIGPRIAAAAAAAVIIELTECSNEADPSESSRGPSAADASDEAERNIKTALAFLAAGVATL
jgi:AcrR family transcriptional regulator